MIVGRGLLATTFREGAQARPGLVVHAAGVSNSQCSDPREFERERLALQRTLEAGAGADCLLYFSTCSIEDPASAHTPYVQHKVAMEALVRAHPRHLVLRLPQLAGRTPNPHTLLNYLYARIARGERFAIWARARRNVLDCEDARTVGLAIVDAGVRRQTVAVAATRDWSSEEIVATMERVTRGHAVYDVLDKGAAYPIDVAPIRRFLDAAGLAFGPDYLERVVEKYYGQHA